MENPNQVCEDTFPNTKFEVVKEIDSEHLIKIEPPITQRFGEGILLMNISVISAFWREHTRIGTIEDFRYTSIASDVTARPRLNIHSRAL